jgi:hypothetical protein
MDGVVIRAIQPFAALLRERAADSGRTVTPIPLAIAAVNVEMESISPMIFAVRRRSENVRPRGHALHCNRAVRTSSFQPLQSGQYSGPDSRGFPPDKDPLSAAAGC